MFSFTLIWFTEKFNLINALVTLNHFNENEKATFSVILTLLCIIIGYLLGSINFGILISKRMYHEDVRNSGSGNAGSTNMLRTFGVKAALLTFLGDAGKGACAVLIGGLLLGTNQAVIDGAALAGLFCVIGHMFPVFFKFKGGKGVATTCMIILVTRPFIFLILLAAFLVIAIGTKYISLASVISAMLYPIFLFRLDTLRGVYGGNGWNVLCAVLIALLILFAHRSNLKRLYEGKEPKFSIASTPNSKK